VKGTYWEARQRQGRFDFAKDVGFDAHYQINWLIGDVFEALGRKIVGGKTELYDKMRAGERGTQVPDLINFDTNTAYEVKGSSWGRAFKVSASQLANYRLLTKQEFPLDHPEIHYIFFGYSVFGKWVDYKTEMNLIKTLCKSVRFAVILPLSVVDVFNYTHPHVTWKREQAYHGLKELILINIKMADMWDIQIRPEAFLAWLDKSSEEWSLPVGKYKIENSWSRPFRLCQFGVSKFPITTVTEVKEGE
jgi:hypothetical protein